MDRPLGTGAGKSSTQAPAADMNKPLGTGVGKSSTQTTAAPATPTPDAARPLEVAKAAQTLRAQGDAKTSDHERRKRISEAAFYKAERRGFAPGGEERDWLEAEREVDGGKDPGKLRPEDNTFPSPK